ncbi:hypothetical protein [uncultured Nostoc sp.]
MSIATFAKGIGLGIYPKLSALCNSSKAIAMPTTTMIISGAIASQ